MNKWEIIWINRWKIGTWFFIIFLFVAIIFIFMPPILALLFLAEISLAAALIIFMYSLHRKGVKALVEAEKRETKTET